MNTHPSPHPRFICRVVRYSRAVFADAGQRHISGCADCQAFVHASENLTRELRRDAVAIRQAAPVARSGFERRIRAAIRDEPVAAQPSRYRASAWAMVAVTGGAIAAVLLFQRPVTQTRSVATSSEDAVVIADAVESFSAKLTHSVIPKTGAVVANNPLQQELGFVYSDARSALDFLAVNFLPTETPRTATPRS